MNLIFMGCGALGSQIAMSIHLQDKIEKVVFVDDDKVGPENIGTSYYYLSHVGQHKARVLSSLFYQKWRVEVVSVTRTIEAENDKPKYGNHLVIDTFDNPRSRIVSIGSADHVLHAMVGHNQQGSVLWGEDYPLPEITYERGESGICTNALGATIIRLTAAYAASSIDEFLRNERKFSFPVVWRYR